MNPYDTENADGKEYEQAVSGGSIQYFFSENSIAETDLARISWNDVNENTFPLSFPGTESRYLYDKDDGSRQQDNRIFTNLCEYLCEMFLYYI